MEKRTVINRPLYCVGKLALMLYLIRKTLSHFFLGQSDEPQLPHPTYTDWDRDTMKLSSVEWICDGLVSVEWSWGSDV